MIAGGRLAVYLVWCRRNRGVIRTTPHFRNDAWRAERVAWYRRETGRDLWIQWDDVDLEGGFLKIVTGRNGHRTKGGKSRWVPISPRRRVAEVTQPIARFSLRFPEGETPEPQFGPSFAWSPDGARFVYSGAENQLWVRERNSTDPESR